MAIELCLFDLDNTLLRTDDLAHLRGAHVGDTSAAYTAQIVQAFNAREDRLIYTPEHLAGLKAQFANVRFGVFTRSPRHYALTLLQLAYPGFQWSVVVAYEDVANTKPSPDGIYLAARQTGVQYSDRVVLVGDEKVDVVCAYRAGCWSFIDQTTWHPRKNEHWWALERVPDALFEGPDELAALLASPHLCAPELEYLIAGNPVAGRQRRIDKINHFFPRHMNLRQVPIHVMGRLFGEYEEIRNRRQWHALTDQILAHKDAVVFPGAWVEAIQRFAHGDILGKRDPVVTVVPFKPGRLPRLESLLAQTAAAYRPPRVFFGRPPAATFVPDVLGYREGALSHHGHHLTPDQRFANAGDHLFVNRPDTIRGKHVIVIDDVVTTGATLLWSHRYLMQAGAESVSCLALAHAIGAH